MGNTNESESSVKIDQSDLQSGAVVAEERKHAVAPPPHVDIDALLQHRSSRANVMPRSLGRARAFNVLVIDSESDQKSYARMFHERLGKQFRGLEVRVYVGLWADLRMASYSSQHAGLECFVDLKAKDRVHSFQPHFVLVRSQVCGAFPEQDWRNLLYAFMFAQVPSVNSFHSIYMASQRVLMMAELNKIRAIVGPDNFPVIDQNFYPRGQDMAIGPQFPAVLKVSAAHAGFGKTICNDHHHWADLRSVVSVTPHYCTAEALVDGEYDLRIQRIATGHGSSAHYRVLRRVSISGNWKTNTGSSMAEEIEMLPRHKLWADLGAQIFEGLDVCAVDVIHDRKTGRDYILEVNDTAIGLFPEAAEEDTGKIVDLCVTRIHQYYPDLSSINQASSSNIEASSSNIEPTSSSNTSSSNIEPSSSSSVQTTDESVDVASAIQTSDPVDSQNVDSVPTEESTISNQTITTDETTFSNDTSN